jgi:hypothetical protein
VLEITVTLGDTERGFIPVPRHVLLISDNPASAEPRRVITGPDGKAVVRLPPGSYIVESDRPATFNGRAYQWTQVLDITAGTTTLRLTAANATVEAAGAASTSAGPASAPAAESDPIFLLNEWRDSIVAVWTPTTRATGFVIDRRGLVVTNHQSIGSATSAEVQLSPSVKVTANVITTDATKDVAVLWIDPALAGAVRPLDLRCSADRPTVANGQAVYTISVPLRREKSLVEGNASRVMPRGMSADFDLDAGESGGPVFVASGTIVGVTTIVPKKYEDQYEDTRVVRLDAACEVVAAAEKSMQGASAPAGTRLPVEPIQEPDVDALRAAAARLSGMVRPYTLAAADFDVSIITPVLTYAVRNPPGTTGRREPGARPRLQDVEAAAARPLLDFGTWSEYVFHFPPVLFVRVTPKLVEGFWTKVARTAAQTQGLALPPIKRFTSGFSRMRAFCGDTEVTPIHPFTIVQRLSESDAIHEGLYAFDPESLGPQCASVRLELFSEKSPSKADSHIVDPKLLEQIRQDFAAYKGRQ